MEGTSGWGGVVILNRMIREDFTDKIYLERPRRREEVGHVNIWRKIATKRGNNLCKDPGARTCLKFDKQQGTW